MTQDKFFDSYIEDFYELGAENNNVFWFRGNKGDNDYVKTTRKIEFIGDDPVLIKNKLLQLKPNDNIFIHWYDMFIGEIVYDLPNKLFVSLMGGDFYADPIEVNLKYLYEKRTLKLVYKVDKYLRPIYFRRNVYQMFKRYFLKRKERKLLYNLKHKYIARIDYILAIAEAGHELQLLKKRYPKFKAEHLSFNFNQNFDETLNIDVKPNLNEKKDRLKILLGNSLDPANNHLDAFNLLKGVKSIIDVYCPLSYGDIRYKNLIIDEGYKLFDEHFYPVTDFMNKEEYIQFVNSMDIVCMNHIRSQAMSNIAIALTLNKPVYLNHQSPVFKMYNTVGVKCHDIRELVDVDLGVILGLASKSDKNNYIIIHNIHSKKYRLFNLRKILSINFCC